MPKTLALVAGRVVVDETPEVKVARARFSEVDHPRDRKGRFIEKGATVSIFGGGQGTVLRNAGYGKIDVARTDGKIVRVHRNYLTVEKRPGGGKPSADPQDVEALAPEKVTGSDAPVEEPTFREPDDEPNVDASADPTAAQSVADAASAATYDDNADEEPEEGSENVYRPPTEFDLSAGEVDYAIGKI